MTQDRDRAEFEAWASDPIRELNLHRMVEGDYYSNRVTRIARQAWQAAKASEAAQQAEAARRLRELSQPAEQERACRWVYQGAAGFGALWSTECDEVVEDNHHIGDYCPHCGDMIVEDE